MSTKDEIAAGLAALGELLASRNLAFDIVVVGGGALLLNDLIDRPTLDMDVVALKVEGRWSSPAKLPTALVEAVREVAAALDLPREPRDEKDWINAGPAFLHRLGLPDGFEERVAITTFGGLTVRVASRVDLIALKLWAATDSKRGARRRVDIEDLRRMAPTVDEIGSAVDWCALKDGRPGFVRTEARQVLEELGFAPEELGDE